MKSKIMNVLNMRITGVCVFAMILIGYTAFALWCANGMKSEEIRRESEGIVLMSESPEGVKLYRSYDSDSRRYVYFAVDKDGHTVPAVK